MNHWLDVMQKISLGHFSKLPVELTLTTNGTKVDEFIDEFKSAGIQSINVSHSIPLNPQKFLKLQGGINSKKSGIIFKDLLMKGFT